ncbi:hypothetical protein ABX026_15160 [Snodgrassella alvi]
MYLIYHLANLPMMLSRTAGSAPVQDIAAGETRLTLNINGKIQITGLPE